MDEGNFFQPSKKEDASQDLKFNMAESEFKLGEMTMQKFVVLKKKEDGQEYIIITRPFADHLTLADKGDDFTPLGGGFISIDNFAEPKEIVVLEKGSMKIGPVRGIEMAKIKEAIQNALGSEYRVITEGEREAENYDN
jgi:hypothetical protein